MENLLASTYTEIHIKYLLLNHSHSIFIHASHQVNCAIALQPVAERATTSTSGQPTWMSKQSPVIPKEAWQPIFTLV